MCQSPHHFDQLLHHLVTSICTFPASDLRAWLPITRIRIRPRKQTYWAAKFLVVISWGKPSGSSGIRLPPTQSTDFPESLEHSIQPSKLFGCFIVHVRFWCRMVRSDAVSAGYVHAFQHTSIAATIQCKKCGKKSLSAWASTWSTQFDTRLQHRWTTHPSNPQSVSA